LGLEKADLAMERGLEVESWVVDEGEGTRISLEKARERKEGEVESS